LITELSNTAFEPERYHDEYRTRVLAVAERKVEGKEISSPGPRVQKAQVVDLMEALKQSLESRASTGSAQAKKPAKAKAAPAPVKERKTASKS
jgi:DNA end-binding protein Ku